MVYQSYGHRKMSVGADFMVFICPHIAVFNVHFLTSVKGKCNKRGNHKFLFKNR